MERHIGILNARRNRGVGRLWNLAWRPDFQLAVLVPSRGVLWLEWCVREQRELVLGFDDFRCGLEGCFRVAFLRAAGGATSRSIGCFRRHAFDLGHVPDA